MKLSILIPTLDSRIDLLTELLNRLQIQTHNKPVQVVHLSDNGSMSVGGKRNMLLDLAQGEYVTFVDDDDTVSSDYVSQLLQGIETGADVVCFNVMYYNNGKLDKPVKYSIQYESDYNDRYFFYRIPNHLMCVKKVHALDTRFKNISFGEDSDYARRLKPLLKTETQIHRVLYNYLFNAKTSQTINKR